MTFANPWHVSIPGLVRVLVMMLIAFGLCAPTTAPTAYAADGAPLGAWRTTNDCFLAAFVLTENGRVRAVYQTGERDENAAWTWDGSTLTITSPTFDLDRFAGQLKNEHLEADYVWHDLDKDQLNRQACVFERFAPLF
jgi:hypothetical protein